MDSIGKKIFVLIICILFLGVTMYSALGITLDSSEDLFILSAGESVEGFLIASDVTTNVKATTEANGFIFFGENDFDTIYEGTYLIPYFVTIPNSTVVDIYEQTIIIRDGNNIEEFNVKLIVQKPFAVKVNIFFNSFIDIGIMSIKMSWIIIGLILMILSIMILFSASSFRGKK